jgi:Tfp pilus assembly protein PilF
VQLLLRLADAELASGALQSARTTVEKVLDRDPANVDAVALLRRMK